MKMKHAIWFKIIEDPQYKYELTRAMSFRVPELGMSNLRFYNKRTDYLVAQVYNGKLTLYKGFRWDGCTLIGNLKETLMTLIASLLHDFLYQLSEQSTWNPPFTQRQADVAFRKLLPCWAKPLYFLGVRAAGWAYWGDKEDSLTVKSI